jgi:hypothetical protein
VRVWSEPVDLPLLLSQTKYNWSLAADEADIYSGTYDMVSQCVAGGQPKLQIGPHHDTYEVVVCLAGASMVCAG